MRDYYSIYCQRLRPQLAPLTRRIRASGEYRMRSRGRAGVIAAARHVQQSFAYNLGNFLMKKRPSPRGIRYNPGIRYSTILRYFAGEDRGWSRGRTGARARALHHPREPAPGSRSKVIKDLSVRVRESLRSLLP